MTQQFTIATPRCDEQRARLERSFDASASSWHAPHVRTHLTVAFTCLIAGCSGAAPNPDRPRRPPPPDKTEATEEFRYDGPRALDATHLVDVPNGTFGPYIGTTADSGVLLWAARADDKSSWFTRDLTRKEAKPLRVADAPSELGLVAVKSAGAKGSGYIAINSAKNSDGEAITVMLLGPSGSLASGPTGLAQGPEPVLWVDVVPTRAGAIALWALQKGGAAEIWSSQLGKSGENIGAATRVVRKARAWQAATADGGAAVGFVSGEPGSAGTVQLTFLDTTGRIDGETLTVSPKATAESDLDMARVGAQFVLAWSDTRNVESQIYTATINSRGKLAAPAKPAGTAMGDQALLRLIAPHAKGSSAYLAWENLEGSTERLIHIGALNRSGQITGSTATLKMAADGAPEFAATKKGVAALTIAPACQHKQACDSPDLLPTFAEFDATLQPVASEPMRLHQLSGRAVGLAWGLHCPDAKCFTLAAEETSPAPIFRVQVEPRSAKWQPVGAKLKPSTPPRIVGNHAVTQTDPLAAVAAVSVNKGTLVSWVTYFDPNKPYQRRKTPAPDGRFEPLRAQLRVRLLPKSGPAAPEHVISYRARSLGGVALSPGNADEVLQVWSAIDNGQPQVFTTLLSGEGAKKSLRMLTRSKGEVSDVTAEFVGDGWLIGWIDSRHGRPEVYITKVNKLLQRVIPERRLTNAEGTKSGVRILRQGGEAVVAWSDARRGKQGFGDIYTATVSAVDGLTKASPKPVQESAAHAYSPVLASHGSKTVVAWLEHDKDGKNAGVKLLSLGSTTQPKLVAAPDDGALTGLAGACSDAGCRWLLSRDAGSSADLWAVISRPSAKATLKRLSGLSGPASQVVSPVLLDDAAFVLDQRRGKGRVRRMEIEW